MASFYSSSTNQMDVMPTFYTRDPGPASYPESSTTSNMVYPHYSSSVPYSGKLTGNNQSLQNCIDPPAPASMISQDSSAGGSDFASHLSERPYNVLRDGRNEVLFMQTIDRSLNGVSDLAHSSVADDPHMSLHTQLGILNGQNLSLQQSNISTAQRQALSLSLSTQIPVPSFQFQPANLDISILSSHQSNLGDGRAFRDDICRNKLMHSNASPYDISSITSTIPNSRYLKAAQQLLDEVVNIQKALNQKTGKTQSLDNSAGATDSKDNDAVSKGDGMSLNPQESQSPIELSSSERQDLQNKMMKLLAMLDEVDGRYKQYYHQMQIVVSSFDGVAGCGSAKPYTALALKTISRQFRCLRDAINSQIQATKKSLGERDSSNSKGGGGISRLKYVDQRLRQQRAMQQLGMVHHNAWRPQRGLPETSVTVLRAWLFEHFLHPYPKDSEKLMLARQTGLTRSQISNWFINARVRLWKPMIEEMYKEEIGETEMDSNSSLENIPKSKDETGSSEERERSKSPATERCHASQLDEPSKSNVSDMHVAGTGAGFPNEANADDTFMNLMLKERRHGGGDCGLLLHDAMAQKSDGSGRLVAYQMAESGRYGNGGVSLTLGLQHCDGGLPVSNRQQSFLGARGEDVYGAGAAAPAPPPPPPPLEADAGDYYDCINLMDRRPRYGPSPLLHDFVA